MSTPITSQFAGYRVHEPLGVGATSRVHRAVHAGDDGLEREVALRRMHAHLDGDDEASQRFLHGATLAQDLSHPSLVKTYDAGRSDGRPFAAMELVRGRTLASVVQRSRGVGRVPHGVAAALIRDLCDAVGYAYARLAFVHGGIGLSKVMVEHTGRLVLVGFGRRAAGPVAPESYQGRRLDARADVFSIGVLAYELVTRKSVIGNEGGYDAMSRVMRGELVPPRAFDPRCPGHIESIVMRALSSDPGSRYPSAVGMRDALDAAALVTEPMATRAEVAAWVEWAFAPAGRRGRMPTAPMPTLAPEPPGSLESDVQTLRRVLLPPVPARNSARAPGAPRRPSRVAAPCAVPRPEPSRPHDVADGTPPLMLRPDLAPPELEPETERLPHPIASDRQLTKRTGATPPPPELPPRNVVSAPRVRALGTLPPVAEADAHPRPIETAYIVINTPDGPRTRVLEDLPPRPSYREPKRS